MSEVNTIKESYARNPNRWNVTTMMAVGTVLYAIMAFYVTAQFTSHSAAETAHPAIVLQMRNIQIGQNVIKADLKMMAILDTDRLICSDRKNDYYRDRMVTLILEWEKATGEDFPYQLLRCTNGNS